MEETIDLREYFYIIKRKLWIIALLAIICGLISGLIIFFMLNSVYEGSMTLIVNKKLEEELIRRNTSDDLNFV